MLKFSCVIVDGNPWFEATEVATLLNYIDTVKSIRNHDDKHVLCDLLKAGNHDSPTPPGMAGLKGNSKNVVFINESGLHFLLFGSQTEEAKVFETLVTREVVPSLRKAGQYEYQGSNNTSWAEVKRLAIGQEHGLHYKVVEHIRTKFLDVYMAPGLGEH
jgi:prophage antirepressor-like protein